MISALRLLILSAACALQAPKPIKVLRTTSPRTPHAPTCCAAMLFPSISQRRGEGALGRVRHRRDAERQRRLERERHGPRRPRPERRRDERRAGGRGEVPLLAHGGPALGTRARLEGLRRAAALPAPQAADYTSARGVGPRAVVEAVRIFRVPLHRLHEVAEEGPRLRRPRAALDGDVLEGLREELVPCVEINILWRVRRDACSMA